MTNRDSYDSKPASRRFTLRSVRPALAISAVSLSILGLSQVNGTSATWQDTNNVATSGGLTIAADVVPAVAAVSCETVGQGTGSQDARLKWNHLGPAYKYRVDLYKSGTDSRFGTWEKIPDETFPAGGQITSDITSDDTTYEWTNRDYTAQVYTINRFTGEVSTSWRGHAARRGSATWNVWCTGSGLNTASVPMAFPDETSRTLTSDVTATTSPSPAMSTTATPSAVPSTATPTPPTNSTTTPSKNTTATTTAPTTTTPSATAPSTTTAAADTTVGAAAKSTFNGYSAALVKSSESSQTALVISDANGEELKRISATASTQYKWDPSTDTLWIVDGGQLYKASGNTWTKTSVDPTSSDVPADTAALVE